jgi:hypothetical protein
MIQSHTSFDALLTTARDLALTVVAGRLWPPLDGHMWIGGRSLDTILCPDQAERQVAILIAPGGPGETHVNIGRGILNAEGLARLARDATAAGGSLHQGRLVVRTSDSWLTDHDGALRRADTEAAYDAARTSGWPAHGGHDAVLFLDDQSIYALLAQVSVGRTATLRVGTIVQPGFATSGQT